MGREVSCHLSVHLTAFDRVTVQRPSAETARGQNNSSNTGYLSRNGILYGMVTCLAGEMWRAFSGSGAVGSVGKTLCEVRHLVGKLSPSMPRRQKGVDFGRGQDDTLRKRANSVLVEPIGFFWHKPLFLFECNLS